jgi:hypothetical protein
MTCKSLKISFVLFFSLKCHISERYTRTCKTFNMLLYETELSLPGETDLMFNKLYYLKTVDFKRKYI